MAANSSIWLAPQPACTRNSLCPRITDVTNGCLLLDFSRLEEPSSIAHSAFMMLALLNAPARHTNREVALLAEGILRQQRSDGSFQVYFDNLPDAGEELYAGEAMLALLEHYRHSSDDRCLHSVARGLACYDSRYFRSGRIGEGLLVFFANWQSQAGRLFFEYATDHQRKGVADYLFRMHDQIIKSGFYADVERDPDQQVSVEAACAVEGLNDAYAIAQVSNDERATRYRQSLCEGLAYLRNLQCVHGGAPKEQGGFGMSLSERAQRIDVTGHAASAFMKSVDNGIECDLPSRPSRVGEAIANSGFDGY